MNITVKHTLWNTLEATDIDSVDWAIQWLAWQHHTQPNHDFYVCWRTQSNKILFLQILINTNQILELTLYKMLVLPITVSLEQLKIGEVLVRDTTQDFVIYRGKGRLSKNQLWTQSLVFT